MESNSEVESGPAKSSAGLQASRVYPIAGAALLLGLAVGYFIVGARTAPPPARAAAPAAEGRIMPNGHPVPTMEQMKALADLKAAPLLEQLKSHPKDAKLLAQVAALYNSAHQFQDATNYYKKALEVDPKNVSARTELASNLYYSGDVDGAIGELQRALKYDPNDVNAEFNLGMIKFRGKDDAAGAIAVWQQLLKTHPGLDRKPAVEQMINEAKRHMAAKN